MKRTPFLLPFLFLIFITNASQAQVPTTYTLRMVLLDSISQKPVEFATVAIYEPSATAVSKFAVSDKTGLIVITGIARGSYTMKIELMGYNPKLRPLTFDKDKEVDMGKILMVENVTTIDGATVTAIGNPIIAKKDTIQYNASSFKTTDNDKLEDLLKKLPGVEVDADGKITANGKEITQVMIGGKTFFLNDPSIATKNLPAKIVDKVNVVNRKSEQARFTGIDDGNEETVLDLSIRPGMLNGWFGTLSGGYGTDDRYQANAMLGRFENTTQVAFVGNANNTNNRGFFDAMGGMMQSMRGGGGGGIGMGGGGVRIGGTTLNFGGNGITTSWNAGVNANGELMKGKLKLGGSYFYGGSENYKEARSNRQNFLPDSSFLYNQEGTSTTHTESHSASMQLEYAFNEKNSILFKPNASLGFGDFNEQSAFESIGAIGGSLINKGTSASFGTSESKATAGEVLLRHRFEKAGRTISLSMNYNYSDIIMDGTNRSESYFYGNNPRKDSVNQIYNQDNLAYTLRGRLSYTEPLGKNYFIELAYGYRYNKNDSDKETYNWNPVTQKYDIKDLLYSNVFENTFINQQAEVNFRSNQEKYSYTVGLNLQPSYTHSVGDTTDLSRNVLNFSPRADFRYNFKENSNLRIEYNGNTNQPSLTQLQPVPDNSNPMYISLGNPDLLPEFSNRLNMEFRNTNMSTFRMIFIRADVRYITDRIINKTWYDEGGKQYVQPVNEGTSTSANLFAMYNSPIARSKFYIMSNTSVSGSAGNSYSNGEKNHTTNFGLREMLRFSYRGEKLELGLSGSANYSKAWYTIESNEKPATWNNRISADINWTLPWGLSLVSDINYTFYAGYSEGYNKPSTVWNASASKLLFKNKATLSFRVYDILQEAKSMNRTTTDNYIEDVETNVLSQYFMLSFTYRFGTFGGQKGGQQGGQRGPGPMMRPGGMGRF